jgi:hypothetical protein
MRIDALNSADKELIMYMAENNMIQNLSAEFNLAEIVKIWYAKGVEDCMKDMEANEDNV